MKDKSQRGFTMLELLVVIAILGIIYIIAIPAYNRYHQKAERAAIISECRSLYRAFVVYFLEYQEYPLALTASDHKFNLETFAPLTISTLMSGAPFDIDIEQFRDKLAGRKAEKFDSPDDQGTNQEFYVILPWSKDPTIKFVVAASDNIQYEDGTVVDSGNWMDGVYITQGGTILGP